MTRTVVVGAGAAGAPLAARLSEDPDRRVVLIEAGRADGRFPAELLDGSTIRGAMPGHPDNWGYLGALTPDLDYTIARGRILGGSSAINGGYFVRARPADFAAWAGAGGAHWVYESALPILEALEDDLDFGTARGHGDAGPMPVRRPPQTNPATQAFTAAARERGFAWEPDKNAAPSGENGFGMPGVGPVPANLVDGVRVNTGLAYIEPARARPNLAILGDRRAVRLRFDGSRVVGVDTTAGPVDADEVVLCCGAIGSAQLLLASGVGPRAQLEAFGIRVVADLPVGEAFSDHPDIAVGWRERGDVFDASERFAFPTALNADSSGLHPSGTAGRHPDGDLEILLSVKPIGYLLTGAASMWRGGARAALRHPIRTARAVAGVSARRAASQIRHGDDFQLIVGLQAPEGRGVLRLRSGDPLDQPRIEYRYLQDERDTERMRLGIRLAVDLLQARPFEGVFGGLTELDERTLDDDRLLDGWMRAHLGTAIHMCGTAPMGPVVDGDGRVHGVTGLRVADTSILPVVPSRGPFATAVFIGELIGRRLRDG